MITNNSVLAIGRVNGILHLPTFWGESLPINRGQSHRDNRSQNLTSIDLSKIILERSLPETGHETIVRLDEADYIPLDLDVLYTMWENRRFPQCFRDSSWSLQTRYLFFDGEQFLNSKGEMCTVRAHFAESGKLICFPIPLDYPRRERDFSVVIQAPVERPEFAGGGWNTKGSIH